jgi:hypothetical protein
MLDATLTGIRRDDNHMISLGSSSRLKQGMARPHFLVADIARANR